MKITWSPTAIADLASLRSYIAQDSPASASQIAQRIQDAAHRLSQFPLSGRTGRIAGTRELVIPDTPYLAANTLSDKEIRIAAILHGKQRWPERF